MLWLGMVVKRETATGKIGVISHPAQVEMFDAKESVHAEDGEIVSEHSIRRPFVGPRRAASGLSHSLCIVQTGHWGDIWNILPIVRHLAEMDGEAPFLSIPPEFASLFDVISYARRVDFDCDMADANAATQAAQQQFERVLRCQVADIYDAAQHKCQSYNQEAWRLCGFLDHFMDESWPLVFDRATTPKLDPAEARPIVVNLTTCRTALFNGGYGVLDAVQAAFPGMVADIGHIWKPQPWNLLPLYDAAKVVVSIDTGTLHLAAASKTPLIALVADGSFWRNGHEWRSAIPRYRCPFRFRYSEVLANPGLLIDAIRALTTDHS